jgi:hypothetical protein
MFYYLDGDRTGNTLEAYFLKENIEQASMFSKSVTSALEDIKIMVYMNGGMVHHCAGDNILFSGKFTSFQCLEMLHLFYLKTNNTASMGIGSTGRDFYGAIKKAKRDGGNTICSYD